MTKNFEGFLTGSFAYGDPWFHLQASSDVDLAICVDDETLRILRHAADPDRGSGNHPHSLRFGLLNLICLTPEEFKSWRDANDELVAARPRTRDQAIAVIERHLTLNNVPRQGGW